MGNNGTAIYELTVSLQFPAKLSASFRQFGGIPMKLLCNIGAVVSMLLVTCGGIFAWEVIMFHAKPPLCLWCFGSAFALSISLYTFSLRDRIDVLEKRINDPSK
jgi:hypothetical protein